VAELMGNPKQFPFFTLLITSFIILFSCGNKHSKREIVSPEKKIISLPYKDCLVISDKYNDAVELVSFREINNIWAVGTDSGLYLIDKRNKHILKYLKFEKHGHEQLFDDMDSIVGYSPNYLVSNKAKDKLLVITNNGIAIQIDLKTYSIDWLTKFLHRIHAATYSDNGRTIAIGTGCDELSDSGQISKYYSSLFLIESHTGKYISHFNEDESVNMILFKDNDTKLLVAYDWNATDSYLWDIGNKEKNIAKFCEDNAYIYNIAIMNDNNFVTVNSNGISKWNIQNPLKKTLIFPHPNAGCETILKNKLSTGYVFIAYSTCYFFDSQFNLTDSCKFPMKFESASYGSNDSIIIMENLFNNNDPYTSIQDGKQGYYSFNIATRVLSLYIDTTTVKDILNKK
jgi:hypothetical protein